MPATSAPRTPAVSSSSRSAATDASHMPSTSRSTQRGCGELCGRRLLVVASALPVSSNRTALVTVRPESRPMVSVLIALPRVVAGVPASMRQRGGLVKDLPAAVGVALAVRQVADVDPDHGLAEAAGHLRDHVGVVVEGRG